MRIQQVLFQEHTELLQRIQHDDTCSVLLNGHHIMMICSYEHDVKHQMKRAAKAALLYVTFWVAYDVAVAVPVAVAGEVAVVEGSVAAVEPLAVALIANAFSGVKPVILTWPETKIAFPD